MVNPLATCPPTTYRPRIDARLQHLIESRARLVACTDSAREELGRTLHDGPQQRVVAVALLLRALEPKVDDPDGKALVAQALEELSATADELRELARRLHPVVLSERGLKPALFAATTRATVPVELDVPEERYPARIERAAYDVVVGAVEHACPEGLAVAIARVNGHVAVDVSGCGALDESRLCALADRVETIEGTLEVDGSTLRARFPVAAG